MISYDSPKIDNIKQEDMVGYGYKRGQFVLTRECFLGFVQDDRNTPHKQDVVFNPEKYFSQIKAIVDD